MRQHVTKGNSAGHLETGQMSLVAVCSSEFVEDATKELLSIWIWCCGSCSWHHLVEQGAKELQRRFIFLVSTPERGGVPLLPQWPRFFGHGSQQKQQGCYYMKLSCMKPYSGRRQWALLLTSGIAAVRKFYTEKCQMRYRPKESSQCGTSKCKVYGHPDCAWILPQLHSKVDFKWTPSIFTGYVNCRKGRRIYDLVNDKVVYSKKPKFLEEKGGVWNAQAR